MISLKLTELEGGYNKTRLKRHPVDKSVGSKIQKGIFDDPYRAISTSSP